MLEGVPLESFEPEVRCAPLMPLLCPREGASPRLRRGVVTAHLVRSHLGALMNTQLCGNHS